VSKILLLALAGALGTLARYGTGVLVERHATGIFPWPTLIVNMIGCFTFGLIYMLAEERFNWTGDIRVIILTGFLLRKLIRPLLRYFSCLSTSTPVAPVCYDPPRCRPKACEQVSSYQPSPFPRCETR